jgi:opacity protein-like surface antigen
MEIFEMKKVLLLSGIALLTAPEVHASAWQNMHREIVPYVGAEYVYSRAKQGGLASDFKENFHSGKADLGMQLFNNWDLEFSYQQTGELKNKSGYEGRDVKNYLSIFALDLYGKYPIMCSNLGMLATAGAAINHANYKGLPDKAFTRVGYRAGLGLQYDMGEHWAARVVGRYSYIGADRLNNLKEVTVGMLYRF